MAEYRVLIVDDEPLARRGIRQLLAPYSDVQVVAECRDGHEALQALTKQQPDLVFLDVQMPGLDGFGLIRVQGVERMPLTVFVTAHDDFAVRAFETEALDYLVKPLSETRFRTTMKRVLERLRARHGERVAVPTGSGELLLDAGEIDWIEACDDYVAVHAGGAQYRVRVSLAALARRLDPVRFARIHRSAIVRLDHIREIRTGGRDEAMVVRLRDGTELPVSRRRLSGLKQRFRPIDR